MNNDNINNYLPSILNPRAVRKQHDLSLTQNSIASRCSLSLKRPNALTLVKPLETEKLNNKEILPKGQNVIQKAKDLTAKHQAADDGVSFSFLDDLVTPNNKENSPNIQNLTQKTQKVNKDLVTEQQLADDGSINFSFLEDLVTPIAKKISPNIQNKENKKPTKDLIVKNQTANCGSVIFSFLEDLEFTQKTQKATKDDDSPGFSLLEDFIPNKHDNPATICDLDLRQEFAFIDEVLFSEARDCETSCNSHNITVPLGIELKDVETESISTVIYSIDVKPTIKVSFGVNESKTIKVNAKNSAIKRFAISHNDNNTNVDCELIENSQLSTETEVDENMNETSNPLKRPAVAVSLEIKKKKLTEDDGLENSKVLILNTNAIEKISHVIVQPPNYKFLKRNISHKSKYKNDKSIRNGNANSAGLRQVNIESFFQPVTDATLDVLKQLGSSDNDASKEMSKNLGVIDAVKCERVKSAKPPKELEVFKSPKRGDSNESPQSARLSSKKDVRTSNSSATPPPRSRNESMSAHTPRKNVESIHFSLPVKSKSNKTSLSPRNIPHHKIVAGTHFAVDAFSYGEIPNVKHYFLTHFHSDHYSGLKKTFSKLLFCSKITADLCILRLGVNPKNIRVINVDEVLRIEGVEVAAVDANHCPGALMLVFTLPNGKTLLHTGDFRACPQMESYPVFWNKDIHTVYLDTTYCNPRYDFPTQDQSLEAALYILRQKKMALEKAGKKFSSVLIVCGTYTIGKEKFFMGMSRRVGCSVWACPEKERVLQTVEGRSFSREKPEACQLHVVPMRDLAHEKLRDYLDSLQGAFAEVVAFKPSGWENGKNSSVEKDSVTIHGIPYSEHSSFSELIRFVKFLKPRQVVPTVDISGGVKAVQKYFPCPLVYKDEFHCQTKVTDYFSIHSRQQVPAVT